MEESTVPSPGDTTGETSAQFSNWISSGKTPSSIEAICFKSPTKYKDSAAII